MSSDGTGVLVCVAQGPIMLPPPRRLACNKCALSNPGGASPVLPSQVRCYVRSWLYSS
jgi:hypothetical protein